MKNSIRFTIQGIGVRVGMFQSAKLGEITIEVNSEVGTEEHKNMLDATKGLRDTLTSFMRDAFETLKKENLG